MPQHHAAHAEQRHVKVMGADGEAAMEIQTAEAAAAKIAAAVLVRMKPATAAGAEVVQEAVTAGHGDHGAVGVRAVRQPQSAAEEVV
jgi:dihydroxyacetone kinase